MTFLHTLQNALSHFMPFVPPPYGWSTAGIILGILLFTAIYDAFKGIVPDTAIILGLFISVAVQGLFADWDIASHHLLIGFIAGMVLWAVNQAYYTITKHDAFGMGDAKWTFLAVTSFTYKPVVVAWIIGAWLGLIWLGLSWALHSLTAILRRRPAHHTTRVHFAPFLMTGLGVGLWWFCLRV